MSAVLPFPWDTLRRLQTVTDSPIINARTQGQEEALCLLVEELALGKIPTDAEEMERRYRTLSANRAVKYRHRKTLAGRVVYEHREQHFDHHPVDLMALQQLATLVSGVLEPQEWALLRELSDGGSYREVARKLSIPIGTVKARVSRLRRYLRNTEVASIIRQSFEAA